MINQEFDHIISLGGHCQTAYQIRRHFGVDKAYPLDWWVTPTVALVRLFESGFAHIFQEENMRIVDENTGPAVMCSHYGLMHYHDFDEAKINGIYSPYLVRTKCATNNSKFAYLMTRLLNVSGRVLFVRFSHGWVQNYPHGTMFTEELLHRFMAAARAMLPNAEVNFLILNDYDNHVGLDGNPFPGVYTSVVNNYDEQHFWYGSNRGWTEMFEYHNIRWSGAPKPAEEPATSDAQQAA
ncbi:DUF1796 family putative cysteine peptidase [Burkholderia gladioli]|uniref:DUF1796 family putative cysteine peptidase n=1 Tax=Burkholderia gladioli TaxID=28095 RepID=UPI00163E1C06|nr:DUF1796 family putative cysteine peptidase [Burkholderia gladioli]MBU9167669.1 papain-like cysteine peptidase [Burkholderia gladioli]MBU9380233.1 papain-like cysteine peptidase [Burkholderia gladioli]MDA0576301.1 papain-like cysteine peptidase [Burkholderia gladioli]MDA0604389.1 papain-like cysteine peptidase [Burkholderia gladioli]